MKKIVIDARELRTSTGRYVERLLHYLQKTDNTHEYLVLLKPEDMDSWKPTNPNFKKVACPYKEFTFAEQLGLLRLLNRLKPDLVHFVMVQQPILYRGKVVTTMNDLTTVRFRNPSKNALIFILKQTVYKFVNKVVAKKSKALITYTDFVKKDVADYCRVGQDKITTTYLAADKITDKPEPIEGLQNQTYIMYIGRPLPHKNLPALVEAFRLLKPSYPNLKLVLAGKKDLLYEQIEQSVKDKHISDVIFTGFISEGQLRWLYENTSAYVFPSLSEGFGLPGLEAMTHGAPVVSSNATCLPEVYGDAALYFDPKNMKDISEKIAQVLNNPTLNEKLRDKGEAQIRKYSWERMAQQTLEVYERVLGK